MNQNLHAKSLIYALNFLKSYSEQIQKIYLYGSCARCEQTKTSDVDLFLFMAPDTSPKLMRKIRAGISPDDTTLPEVDVHFSTGSEFSGCKIFNNELKKETKLLWERD